MEFLEFDPRVLLIAGGVAIVGSERVRKTVGRGVFYVAAGAMKIGSPVVDAGRDILSEARDVASPDGKAKSPEAKPAAAA
jgi:hypothetical protein